MTFKKTKLVLGLATAIFALGSTAVTTEAVAKSYKKSHKKKKSSKKRSYRSYKVAPAYVAPTSVSTTSAMQSQIDALRSEVSSLKAQTAQAANSASQAQVDALSGKVTALESKKDTKDNMVFFRGGYARSERKRDGVSIETNAVGGALPYGGPMRERADNDAWYFGAGMDFSFDDNLFGLMDNTEVLGEVMFEYKEFNDTVKGNALATDVVGNNGQPIAAAGGMVTPRDVTVSQFTLAASPKIKFLKGSDFRPWVIPFGFTMNVISPPSESITVLNPGVMFGAGADYKLWKNIFVGVDARYNWSPERIDGVNTSGMTAGGYIGLGF